MTTNHTPWRVENNTRGTFLMHENYCVARIDERDPRQLTGALAPHIASIRKRLTAERDELVAALRQLLQATRHLRGNIEVENAVRAADAALAKVAG